MVKLWVCCDISFLAIAGLMFVRMSVPCWVVEFMEHAGMGFKERDILLACGCIHRYKGCPVVAY